MTQTSAQRNTPLLPGPALLVFSLARARSLAHPLLLQGSHRQEEGRRRAHSHSQATGPMLWKSDTDGSGIAKERPSAIYRIEALQRETTDSSHLHDSADGVSTRERKTTQLTTTAICMSKSDSLPGERWCSASKAWSFRTRREHAGVVVAAFRILRAHLKCGKETLSFL